jgi:hypothetical protein
MAIKIYGTDTLITRFLFERFVDKDAPTLVVIAGVHGNEVSGIYAVNSIIEKFKKKSVTFKANLYIIAGNLNAISKGIRYESKDLNRLWSDEQLLKIADDSKKLNTEEKEQKELYQIIINIQKKHTGSYFFIDLHTTSSPTIPYLTYSDSIKNRVFSRKFPIPSIFGLEEYIQGPLLTYVTEYGHIGIGFEAGKHDDPKAIHINEAFLWMVFVETGCLNKDDINNYNKYVDLLKNQSSFGNKFFEIIDKHTIQENEKFKMIEGFYNFQKIQKNQELAISNSKILKASTSGRIFMPLYQEKGEDGYFVIKKTSEFWLSLSRFVRKNKYYSVLNYLPKM